MHPDLIHNAILFPTEMERTTIVDFDFCINLTSLLTSPSTLDSVANVQLWSVNDKVPAHRGGFNLQVEERLSVSSGQRLTSSASMSPSSMDEEKRGYEAQNEHPLRRLRSSTPAEMLEYKNWKSAPAASSTGGGVWTLEDVGVLGNGSSRLREWCEDYCLSDCYFKTFTFTKVCVSVLFSLTFLTCYHLHSVPIIRLL